MKELFPGLDENELLELWPTYKVDEKKVEKMLGNCVGNCGEMCNFDHQTTL